jgi:ribA/ribD-fused uncharacterized protein
MSDIGWFTRRNGRRTEHNWPSNFFIEPDGSHVEAEYQAAKHAGHPWRQATILRCKPGKAKKLGRRWKLSDYQLMEWNNRKITVMRDLLRQKIYDHPEVFVALCMTGDDELVERNWWHDNFWGDCTCLQCFRIGDNWLGNLWMELRDEIRTDDGTVTEQERSEA